MQLKSLITLLHTLLISMGAWSSEEICGIKYPPPIDFQHYYIDSYLFTFGKYQEEDSEGTWIDPGCFTQHLLVTEVKPKIDDRQQNSSWVFFPEPWYKQKVVHEEKGWKFFKLLNEIQVGDEKYAIFQANTYGNKSTYIKVFLTYPEFKKVFQEHGYLQGDILEDGFIINEEVPWEEARLCEDISTASYPYQKSQYKFSDKSFTKEILEKGECSIR